MRSTAGRSHLRSAALMERDAVKSATSSRSIRQTASHFRCGRRGAVPAAAGPFINAGHAKRLRACAVNLRCIPAQVNGCYIPVQLNGCCIPAHVNGCCISAQVNGCCIPAQVNGCCIPAQVNGCYIPAQVNGPCIPAQVNGPCIPAQVNGCCIPAQVNGSQSRSPKGTAPPGTDS